MRGQLLLATLVLVLVAPAMRAAQPATLLLLDRNHLQGTRARVKQADPALKEAVAALVRDADRALAQKPMSVMDKGVAPPSGDKHDYMSQAPYWWPDSSKPDGRPGLALFTAQRDIARRIAERGRERIARQIEPDGRMPRELERTRGWSYSAMNLDGFVRLARLAEAVGVDLWKYETRDGRSIARAVDFLLPFAQREREWPFQEITAFEPGAIHGMLRRAAGMEGSELSTDRDEDRRWQRAA